jgi:hypothetical protein
MLDGAPGRVVSAIKPLTGFALRRKYSNAVRCRRSSRASSLSSPAVIVVSAVSRIVLHEPSDFELSDHVDQCLRTNVLYTVTICKRDRRRNSLARLAGCDHWRGGERRAGFLAWQPARRRPVRQDGPEGLDIPKNAGRGRPMDAETTALRTPSSTHTK